MLRNYEARSSDVLTACGTFSETNHWRDRGLRSLMASAKKKPNASATSASRPKRRDQSQFVVCVANDGNPASLELHKIHRVRLDSQAQRDGDLRIIDEAA